MMALLAVFSLEWERRWRLLLLAPVLGVCPFALVSLHTMPVSAQPLFGWIFAWTLTGAAVLILGSLVIVGDLVSGRLGFLFARPAPWWAIWGGKFAAALGISVLAGSLTWLLSLLFLPAEPEPLPGGAGGGVGVVGAGILLFALGGAHVASLALRSRTKWLVLDLVALPVLIWILLSFVTGPMRLPLWYWRGPPSAWAPLLFTWPQTLAVFVAVAVAVASGRTDPARSHRAMSLTLWPLLFVIAGGWSAAVWRASHGPVGEFDRAWVQAPAPHGAGGLISGYRTLAGIGVFQASRVLVDAPSPRAIDVPSGFFQEGGAYAWLEHPKGRNAPPVLVIADLSDQEGVPGRTVLSRSLPGSWLHRLIVEKSGRLVAALQDEAAYIFDATSGELEATLATADGGRVVHVVFESAARARLYRASASGGLAIEEWSLPSAARTELGLIAPPAAGGEWKVIHIDADATHLLLLSQAPTEARVVDADSGALITKIDVSATTAHADGVFLTDGRVLLSEVGSVASRLTLLDASGTVLERLEIPAAARSYVVETSPGHAFVSIGSPYVGLGLDSVIAVATDPLRVTRSDTGLFRRPRFGPGARIERDRPAGTRLLLQTDRPSVVLYDVETGEKTLVAGDGPAPD